MATYVLVHGGFAGGYQWREVASLLREAGHEVYTPTLTGLGERVHLARPEIDLDLHVQDVLNVLRYEKLSDVILAGHSYEGCQTAVTGTRGAKLSSASARSLPARRGRRPARPGSRRVASSWRGEHSRRQ